MTSKTNLVLNPRGIAVGSAPWYATYGTGGAGSVSYDTSGPWGGVPSFITTRAKLSITTAPTAASTVFWQADTAAVTVGVTYAMSAYVWTASPVVVAVQIIWRLANGSIVDTTTVNQTVNGWTVVSASGAAPTGSATASIGIAIGWSDATLGSVFYMTGATLVQGTQPSQFFDGYASVTGGFTSWVGVANQSASTLITPTITLTPFTDASPSPRVLVSVDDTPGTVNITRTVDGRTFKVRGGVNLFATGGIAVMDYEAPLGVAAAYQADMFDTSGNSLGATDSVAITVYPGFPDTSYAWISQPLNPAIAVAVPLDAETADVLTNPLPGGVYYAEGAVTGTRIGSRQQGIAGMKLTLKPQTFADADVLRSMFGGYSADFPGVILVRTTTPRLPRVFFASVEALNESVDYVNGKSIFQLVVDEVAPPYPGLVIPLLRRKDIDAAYGTRAARAAAYATRLARDTDFSLAGLAG